MESIGVVNIKTLTGKNLQVKIRNEMTVRQIKEYLLYQENYVIKLQRLIFNGQMLKDEFTLDHYGIKDGDWLHLVLELRGC